MDTAEPPQTKEDDPLPLPPSYTDDNHMTRTYHGTNSRDRRNDDETETFVLPPRDRHFERLRLRIRVLYPLGGICEAKHFI